ncbi:uncharacterized protein PAC_07929 [Phialocephala subalpina]|uniref:Uncharacterized protein n=1 Tax=Phialocephala subalpina TaxID=576137 RepID=A0A1L7WZ34_9HELO|nr:uncharacterized protein PAC_07929 [Phialocephala subalpina]
MSSHQTESCAVPNSDKGRASSAPLPSSKPSLPTHLSKTSHPSDGITASHHTLSAQRIYMYLENPAHSQVLHRHQSSHESMQAHTHNADQFLASFEERMATNDP